MSEELRPCPFCGGTKICTEKGINLNYCDNCSAESNIEQWNTRPIEDALNKRVAELSQAVGLITTLKPTMLMDTEHPLDMAKEVAEYVTARIAELEAERRWIPVSERLPERDGFYLVLENVNQVAGYYHWCKVFGWNTDGGRTNIQSVTHWMPLPELPEVK